MSKMYLIDYTVEMEDGVTIDGEFEQEGHDLNKAENQCKKMHGLRCHVSHLRARPIDMPREYVNPDNEEAHLKKIEIAEMILPTISPAPHQKPKPAGVGVFTPAIVPEYEEKKDYQILE